MYLLAELASDLLNLLKIACQDGLPHMRASLLSVEGFPALLSILLAEFNYDIRRVILLPDEKINKEKQIISPDDIYQARFFIKITFNSSKSITDIIL